MTLLSGFTETHRWRPGTAWGMVQTYSGTWSGDTAVQTAATAAGTNAHVFLTAGTYEGFEILLADGQWFRGEDGTILDGTLGLDPATALGSAGEYYFTGRTEPNVNLTDVGHGEKLASADARVLDRYDLWVDNVRQTHVSSTGLLGAGKWFFDYTADRVYMYDNPAGKTIRLAKSQWAFGDNLVAKTQVSIENMTIKRYASRAQWGAIACMSTVARVNHCKVTEAHGVGIKTFGGSKITNCEVSYSGQLGVGNNGGDSSGGFATGYELKDCWIHHCSELGYDPGWEGGAMKIVACTEPLVQNCWVEDSAYGIWFDVWNINAQAKSNVVRNIARDGIFFEIGFEGTCEDNIVVDSAYITDGGDIAGITVLGTNDVEIRRNHVSSSRTALLLIHPERGSSPAYVPAPYASYEFATVNTVVETNDFGQGIIETGLRLVDGSTDTAPLTTNTFTGNSWHFNNITGTNFYWHGTGTMTWAQWQAAGRDVTGRINSDPTPRYDFPLYPATTAVYGTTAATVEPAPLTHTSPGVHTAAADFRVGSNTVLRLYKGSSLLWTRPVDLPATATAYEEYLQTTSPVGLWVFTDTTGSFLDYSGNNYSGVPSGATLQYRRGVGDVLEESAVRSSFSNGLIDIANETDFTGSNFTWVIDNAPQSWNTGVVDSLAGNKGVRLYFRSNNQYVLYVGSGSADVLFEQTTATPENVHYHIVVRYDTVTGKITLFRNNTKLIDATATYAPPNSAVDPGIRLFQSIASFGGNHQGVFRSFAVYNTALSDAQVTANYNEWVAGS